MIGVEDSDGEPLIRDESGGLFTGQSQRLGDGISKAALTLHFKISMNRHCLILRCFIFLVLLIFKTAEASANSCQSHFFVVSEKELAVSPLSREELIHFHEKRATARSVSPGLDRYRDSGRSGDFARAFRRFSEDLPEILELVRHIQMVVQDKPTLIVGIGRSPSPILAVINELSPKQKILDLPLSVEALPASQEKTEFDYSARKRALTKEQIEEVYSIWGKFLPPPEALGEHKILLIDFASSGESLLYAAQLLTHYYELKGSAIEIETFAFHEKGRGREVDEEEIGHHDYANVGSHDKEGGNGSLSYDAYGEVRAGGAPFGSNAQAKGIDYTKANARTESNAQTESNVSTAHDFIHFRSPVTGSQGWSYNLPPSLARSFIDSEFKILAQYPRYTPLITPLSSLKQRPDYAHFRRQLKALLSLAKGPF